MTPASVSITSYTLLWADENLLIVVHIGDSKRRPRRCRRIEILWPGSLWADALRRCAVGVPRSWGYSSLPLATGTRLMALEVMGLRQWAALVLSVHVSTVMPDGHLALHKPRAAQIAYCGRSLLMRSCMERERSAGAGPIAPARWGSARLVAPAAGCRHAPSPAPLHPAPGCARVPGWSRPSSGPASARAPRRSRLQNH